MDLVAWFKMTRLPSLEILSLDSLKLGSVIGFSLFAIHTGVNFGILLNHIPRYQLGKVKLSEEDLLLPDVKKPNANLPFFEMSLLPPLSSWPSVTVLLPFAAEEHATGGADMASTKRMKK